MTRAGSWAAPAALQGTTSSQLLETGSHCQAPVAFLLLPAVDSVGWFVHGLVLVYPRHPAPGEAELFLHVQEAGSRTLLPCS